MLRKRIMARRFPSLLCGAALLFSASVARAEAPAAASRREAAGGACTDKVATAKARQQAGDLVAAHELYAQCAAETCGGDVWQECVTRENELNAQLPSVVLIVSDHAGEPLVDVKVMVDGRLLTAKLNGLALPVNPGTHTFSFFAGREIFSPQTLTLREGQRNHLIEASGRVAELHAQN